MTTQAERQLPVERGLSERVFKGFHKAKDFLTETVNTLAESTQQAKESLTKTSGQAVNTVTEATDKAVDTVAATAQQAKDSLGETIEQTKGSLEQTLQTTGQMKIATSEAIQTAINSSVSDWLQAHPVAFRMVQLLLWATNHPIVSLVIFVFTVAIAWSLIKAIGRLIETAWLSLLQVPLKLGQSLIRIGYQSLGKFGGLASKRLAVAKTVEPAALQAASSDIIHNDKQQRLAEISTRLEVIQKEQNELLQEAATIFASDKIDIEI